MNKGKIKRIAKVFLQCLKAKLLKKRIPVKVLLQITGRCNMRCSYCYAPFDKYKDMQDPSTEQLKKLIEILYSNGMRWLWIVGGEPLLRKDLEHIVDFSISKGIYTELSTNASLITEKHIPLLKKLDGLIISFDGSEEAHDAARDKKVFEYVKKIIKILVLNGIKPRLHAILSKKTFNSLERLSDFSLNHGLLFNYCEILKEKEDKNNLSWTEHCNFYDRYLEIKRKRNLSANSKFAIKLLRNWPLKEKQIMHKEESYQFSQKRDYYKCRCGDLQCFVDIDGGVYSCSARWFKGKNIFKDGFAAAWDYLKNRECVACRCLGMTEASLLLNLSLKWFFQALTNTIRIIR